MYIVIEALLTIKRIEIININKFIVVVLNKNNNMFVIYIVTLVKLINISIYPSYPSYVTLLISEKTRILTKYFNFFNVFS